MDDFEPALLPPRTPWRADFPPVIVHTDTALRDSHAEYLAAKSGDAEAALVLAIDLLTDAGAAELREILAGQPAILLPITAEETLGFNAIPDAMAQVLARELDLPVSSGEIVQSNTVGHTRARAFNRLVTPATFEGEVQPGARYVLVDDHVGLGGTMANLKGYVETHGGHVVAMTTLTKSRDAHQIALRPETLAVLRDKHGEALEEFWKKQLGHGLDGLTEVEGQLLGREPTLAAIQGRLAQAAVEARGRGVEPAVGAAG